MSDEPKPLEEEELEAQQGEELPDREEMMLIDPSGDALLGPPDLSDPNQ
jgi:hypothetical protein